MRLASFFHRVLNLSSGVGELIVRDVRLEPGPTDRPRAVVRVQTPKKQQQRCGACRRRVGRRHGAQRKARTWRHVGLFGIRVELHGEVGRVVCGRCGVRTTHVPWSRTGSVFTRQFEDEVAWFLQHTDQTATATYFGLSWATVGKIARRVVAEKLDGSLLDDLHFIGVDEISSGRPTKFLTVVVDHEMGRVVWAAEGKSAETLGRFFQELGGTRAATIDVVTMDMSAAFAKSVATWVPQAEIVYDRFHVVRLLLDAVDDVRRDQAHRLAAAERSVVKKSRFALLKNPWNLTRKEKQTLADIQRNNAPLYRAYLLKEAGQDLFTAATVDEADRKFDEWYRWARHSRLAPFVRVAETFRTHWPGIRRFIELKLTNAGVEGYNSKIRMISHRAFGFHTAGALIAMIMLLCSGITITPIGH